MKPSKSPKPQADGCRLQRLVSLLVSLWRKADTSIENAQLCENNQPAATAANQESQTDSPRDSKGFHAQAKPQTPQTPWPPEYGLDNQSTLPLTCREAIDALTQKHCTIAQLEATAHLCIQACERRERWLRVSRRLADAYETLRTLRIRCVRVLRVLLARSYAKQANR